MPTIRTAPTRLNKMNVYATVEEYRDLFPDARADDDAVLGRLTLASRKADDLTYGRIRPSRLTDHQRMCLMLFTCFQAEYLLENEDSDDSVTAYSTGSISVTVDHSKTEPGRLRVSPAGLQYLKLTGLMSGCM